MNVHNAKKEDVMHYLQENDFILFEKVVPDGVLSYPSFRPDETTKEEYFNNHGKPLVIRKSEIKKIFSYTLQEEKPYYKKGDIVLDLIEATEIYTKDEKFLISDKDAKLLFQELNLPYDCFVKHAFEKDKDNLETDFEKAC